MEPGRRVCVSKLRTLKRVHIKHSCCDVANQISPARKKAFLIDKHEVNGENEVWSKRNGSRKCPGRKGREKGDLCTRGETPVLCSGVVGGIGDERAFFGLRYRAATRGCRLERMSERGLWMQFCLTDSNARKCNTRKPERESEAREGRMMEPQDHANA